MEEYYIINENKDEEVKFYWHHTRPRNEVISDIHRYIYEMIIYLLLLIIENADNNDYNKISDKRVFIEEYIRFFNENILHILKKENYELDIVHINELYLIYKIEDKHYEVVWQKMKSLANVSLNNMKIEIVSSELYEQDHLETSWING